VLKGARETDEDRPGGLSHSEAVFGSYALKRLPQSRRLYERDGYKCRYCDKQLTRFTATLDHITPLAELGDNSFGNLATACFNCHSRKHKRPVGDFLAEQ
jgi:5-methylcytosine-specific restriction endonuclease McrA